MNEVYINKIGIFLPNNTIPNDKIDDYIGLINGEVSRVKRIVLKRNGIKNRYYALTTSGTITHSNAEMTANAINGLFEKGVEKNSIEALYCATTTPDQLIPSHSSMVHGRLKLKPIETSTFSGVCLTSLQSLKAMYNSVKLGEISNGICTASELISPTFRSENYHVSEDNIKKLGETPYMEFEREFLRYMLSDGAVALYIENKPILSDISLHLEWVEVKSYANYTSTCMYMGGKLKSDGEIRGWKEFHSEDLVQNNVFSICQDFKILMSGMKYWVDFIEECIEKYNIDCSSVDYVLPHISSMFIGEELKKEMNKRNVRLFDNWFVNLQDVGNIGSASIFIALEELIRTKDLKSGNKILLLVPESARFSYGMAMITVV